MTNVNKRGTLNPDRLALPRGTTTHLSAAPQTFFADPFVQEHVRLDAVVCLCDSPRLLSILAAPPSAALSARGADEAVGEGSSSHREEGKVGVAEEGGASTGGSSAPLVMSQLALSDRVLLNKSDLITPAEV